MKKVKKVKKNFWIVVCVSLFVVYLGIPLILGLTGPTVTPETKWGPGYTVTIDPTFMATPGAPIGD